MAYEISLSHKAVRQFAKLMRDVQARIHPKIDALAEQPRPPGCDKLEGLGDAYRIRVGDYRIVYEIDDARQQITITRIAHRRDVYRGL